MNANKFHCTCELCTELSGSPSRFSSIYSGKLDTRIVGGSTNFVVMPSIGQLGDAHFMIVSRRHETALSALSRDLRQELISLIFHIRSWLNAKLGHTTMFENGDPKGFGRMNCSISHLHVHLVASRQGMPSLARSIQMLGSESVSSLNAITNISDSYSFVEIDNAGIQLIRKQLPSQALRKIVARELGMAKWDWREASVEDQLSGLALAAHSEIPLGNGVSPT